MQQYNTSAKSTKPVSWNTIFMNFCKTLRLKSSCVKYQTSALVTKGTQILGIGYNGTASGELNCDVYWHNVHAIQNLSMSYEEWI